MPTGPDSLVFSMSAFIALLGTFPFCFGVLSPFHPLTHVLRVHSKTPEFTLLRHPFHFGQLLGREGGRAIICFSLGHPRSLSV